MSDAVGSGPLPDQIPARPRLDELLRQVVDRAQDVLANQDRLQGLLSGVVTLSEELDVEGLHQRIVEVARDVVSAGGASMLPIRMGMDAGEVLEAKRLRVPVLVRGEDYCRIELSHPKHAQGFSEDDLQLARVVASAAGAALENALAFAEEARRERWLRVSREITAAILSGASREEALSMVCDQVVQLTDATRCVALLPVRREVFLVAAAAGDAEVGGLVGTEHPFEGSVSAKAMRTGELTVIEDLSVDEDYQNAAAMGFNRAVVVPLKVSTSGKAGTLAGEVLGVLTIVRRPESPPPPPDELELLTAFASQASLSLEYSRAQEDRSSLAVFEDRDRIGRDLHDLVIQRIFAIGMNVNAMIGADAQTEAGMRLSTIVDDLDSTIKDIRQTIFKLQNDVSGTDHRVQIRRAIAEATPGLDQEAVRLDFVGDVASGIPDEQMPGLIEAVRELLDNVMRHARANEIQVTVETGDFIRLVVADNGVGMSEEQTRRVGLGRLAQTAEAVGGALSFANREDGGGLIVEWKVPALDG